MLVIQGITFLFDIWPRLVVATYITLAGGEWAYLAAGWNARASPLFSRRIKGWQLEKHMEASMVHKALKKALVAYPIQEQAIIHSDRGGQYIDKGFLLTLNDHKLRQSMTGPPFRFAAW